MPLEPARKALDYNRVLLSAGFIKRGSLPEAGGRRGSPCCTCWTQGGSWKWVNLGQSQNLDLDFAGAPGSRRGRGRSRGCYILAHCTRRGVKRAISIKMDDIRPKPKPKRPNKKKEGKTPAPSNITRPECTLANHKTCTDHDKTCANGLRSGSSWTRARRTANWDDPSASQRPPQSKPIGFAVFPLASASGNGMPAWVL
jgi:hypothetical protein